MPKLIKVSIIVALRQTGNGTDTNPIRNVEEWYAPDGTLVMAYDGHKDETWGAYNMVEYLRDSEKSYVL